MLVSEDFKRKIYANRDLPTIPIIAQKILTLRNDDGNLAQKLGSIISRDQSLSVKVLTLANSAYRGSSRISPGNSTNAKPRSNCCSGNSQHAN